MRAAVSTYSQSDRHGDSGRGASSLSPVARTVSPGVAAARRTTLRAQELKQHQQQPQPQPEDAAVQPARDPQQEQQHSPPAAVAMAGAAKGRGALPVRLLAGFRPISVGAAIRSVTPSASHSVSVSASASGPVSDTAEVGGKTAGGVRSSSLAYRSRAAASAATTPTASYAAFLSVRRLCCCFYRWLWVGHDSNARL